MKTSFAFLMSTLLIAQTSAFADNKWNDANNPKNFEKDYTYSYGQLPSVGSMQDKSKGWSDSYWPKTRGYILDRWQQPNQAFKYQDYTFPRAPQLMSASDLNLLSPAEKFDIIRGRFDFPLSQKLKEIKSSGHDSWRGVCDGWSRASLAFDEPKSINFVSPITHQVVPLTSGDIKGLLSYYYGKVFYSPGQQVGLSCRGVKKFFDFDGACKDMNAGAFHVVLTNELGLRGKGFAMDRDPGLEVWNQPYVAYESHELGETTNLSKHHSDGTAKEVTVQTTVTYVNELYDTDKPLEETDAHVAPQIDALGIGNQHLTKKTYIYTLELDGAGNIIGGEWNDKDDHPDMMWRSQIDPSQIGNSKYHTKDFVNDDWSVLKDIVEQATK